MEIVAMDMKVYIPTTTSLVCMKHTSYALVDYTCECVI